MDEELLNTNRNKEPVWVNTEADLTLCCRQWSQADAIAIDTEFERSQTFYPTAGLIQIADGHQCYLIDPLAINDFSSLKNILDNQRIIKVLHSCSEDLEVFSHLLGSAPGPVFDTQIAAAFAGFGFSMGYANLVNAVLGIEIPKDETRSNWLQRPLSQSQLTYAAADVTYLLEVYRILTTKLVTEKRWDWVEEDCQRLVNAVDAQKDIERYYRKVKLAWKLSRKELAVLQALCAWREREARLKNVPRSRVLPDRILWEISRRKPKKAQQLFSIEGIQSRHVKNYGDILLDCVSRIVTGPVSDYPERLPAPLLPAQGARLKALKAKSIVKAEELGIPVEVLVRKKDYEFIIRSGLETSGDYQLSERLKGWRQPVIGDLLLQTAAGFGVTTESDECSAE